MQRLEVSGAVRPIYGSLGVKLVINKYIEMQGQQNIKICVRRSPLDECGAVSVVAIYRRFGRRPPFSWRLFLYPEHEGSSFLGNVCKLPTHYAVISRKMAILMEVWRTSMLMREAAKYLVNASTYTASHFIRLSSNHPPSWELYI